MADSSNPGKVITIPLEIREILSQAVLENNPFQLQIDEQIFIYYTHFDPDLNLEEDIQEGNRILIAPLDPPIGNLKLINSKKVTLELFTALHLLEFEVTFLARLEYGTLALSFPDKVVLGKQKRESVRIPIDPKWGLIVHAVRPSGLTFVGRPVDINIGGTCFFCVGNPPPLNEKSRLKIIIKWPARQIEVEANAIVIKHHDKEGEIFFRTKFLFETYKDARAMEEITTDLQRREIKRREEIFGS
ncbi:MAG: PilZ domain-containing protein [Magnetococcales bacterium]|nr:PilZ domain-containing protein [Magnetococcales bacterium]